MSGAWVTGRASARELALLAYIWVDSIQDTVNLVAANGGVIIDAPHPDSPGGSCWIATFHDPGGNMIGLYQET